VIPAALGEEICRGTAAPSPSIIMMRVFGVIASKRNKILTFPLPLWLDIANIDRGEEWGGASSVGRRHPTSAGDPSLILHTDGLVVTSYHQKRSAHDVTLFRPSILSHTRGSISLLQHWKGKMVSAFYG
jgi:hypothetical protein